MRTDIRVRRVYDAPEPADGTRVLVDRVWPRGLRREDARLDEWARDIAPSAELRTWYAHDPARADEFRRRYGSELKAPARQAALSRLRVLVASGPVTLLTATRDVSLSQAAVLATMLRGSGEDRGDAACWAHLVCPECGAVESEGHRSGCRAGAPGNDTAPQ